MLRLSGKCLGVQTEQRTGPTGPFQSTTIHILDGVEVTKAQTGRDFPVTDLPREGEDVELEVSVSAFARRTGGAGVQVTALKRISGARAARPAAVAG